MSAPFLVSRRLTTSVVVLDRSECLITARLVRYHQSVVLDVRVFQSAESSLQLGETNSE